jgi:hypothetical protein
MCAVAAIPFIIMGAAAAAKGISGVLAGNAEAKIAETNAALARRDAANALQLGATQAGQIRAKGTQVASEQKVALAASGVDPSSAGNLFASTASGAELDALTAKNNASKKAWGFEAEAATQDAAAIMARRKSYLGILTGGLEGASAAVSYRGSGK